MVKKDELRPYTVSFTGHRELNHKDVPERLDILLVQLIAQGYRYFGAGGALGFDTEAALAVLRARERYPYIKLIIVSPFPGQENRWNLSQQKQYREILSQAAKVKYTADRYTSDAYHIRNRALINGASLCVAYLVKSNGGTAYTVNYAREQGLKIINIAEDVRL